MTHDLERWERQPGEGDARFAAFAAYRDMPVPRSLRRLGEQIDRDASLVARWSSADGWQDRVAAWDLEQDRQRRAAMKVENVEAGRRHATIAASALGIVSRVNMAWLTRLAAESEPELLAKMPFADLSDLMVRVNRTLPRLVVAERLSRGMTTDQPGAPMEAERERVADMSDAELDAFLAGARSQAIASGTEGWVDPDEGVDASLAAEGDA